ncbi:MAG: nucleotidyl transferase AbiEii/AbiGii toxin family protein [Spirochaetales bacterium]
MHNDSVEPNLLTLLEKLMKWSELSNVPFESTVLRQELEAAFERVVVNSVSRAGVFAFVDGVKLDLVRHDQKWIKPYDQLQTFRLASLADVSAMKVYAVMGRGSKKDFSDLLYLHENGLSLRSSLDNFLVKYGHDQQFSAVRSLNYFDDTAMEPDPVYRNGWTWQYVKDQMQGLSSALAQQLTAENTRKDPGDWEVTP